jgi:hypothetical protein
MKDDVINEMPNGTPKNLIFLWGGKLRWDVEIKW